MTERDPTVGLPAKGIGEEKVLRDIPPLPLVACHADAKIDEPVGMVPGSHRPVRADRAVQKVGWSASCAWKCVMAEPAKPMQRVSWALIGKANVQLGRFRPCGMHVDAALLA